MLRRLAFISCLHHQRRCLHYDCRLEIRTRWQALLYEHRPNLPRKLERWHWRYLDLWEGWTAYPRSLDLANTRMRLLPLHWCQHPQAQETYEVRFGSLSLREWNVNFLLIPDVSLFEKENKKGKILLQINLSYLLSHDVINSLINEIKRAHFPSYVTT